MDNELIETAEFFEDGNWKKISIYEIKKGMLIRVIELGIDPCFAASATYLNADGIPTIQIEMDKIVKTDDYWVTVTNTLEDQ